jgi:hypothetical protein
MEYIKIILGFLTGGGITAIASLRYMKKTSKLDYADRAMKFMEDQNTKLIVRIEALENRVDILEPISCKRMDCNIRLIQFNENTKTLNP